MHPPYTAEKLVARPARVDSLFAKAPITINVSQLKRHRLLVAAVSIVLAALIAGADWLLPTVQLAYVEVVPVMLLAAAFGFRVGAVSAVSVSVGLMILEFNGAFRLKNSHVSVNMAIMAAVLVLAVALFTYFVRTAGIEREHRDARRIERGLRALSDASMAMFGSLNYEKTLSNIAVSLTKTFATSCTIEMLEADGIFRRVAISDARDGMDGLYPPLDELRLTALHPIVRAIRQGQSTCVTTTDEAWAATVAPSMVAALKTRNVRSFMTVPVRTSGGTVMGALTCNVDYDDQRASYVPDDLPFAEELGRRAGIAVEHARAYERERAIAIRFQEASLPKTLPELDAVHLTADYRPGGSEATIGGDWYDAFLLDDGRIAITIGDIVGKGLNAAVTMAQVRLAMRAAAPLLPHPHAMLDVAEITIRDVAADLYATAIAAVYDPALRTLTYASAGHPGPLMRHADGTIADLSLAGTMLGLGTAHAAATTITIDPGSTIVFFTDGLTELTHDLRDGYARLYAALSDEAVFAAINPAGALVEHVLWDEAARDDIAVLVAAIG